MTTSYSRVSGGIVIGVVDTYALLPNPSQYSGKLYYVKYGSGGAFSFIGAYQYPKGLYISDGSIWSLSQIQAKVSEDAETIVNINNWTNFVSTGVSFNPGDLIIYLGVRYQNKSGSYSSTSPDADSVNWTTIKRQLFLDASQFVVSAQTVPSVQAASVGSFTTTGIPAILYAGNQDQNANITFKIPDDYASGARYKLLYAPSTTVAGRDIVLQQILSKSVVGQAASTALETISSQTLPSGTLGIISESGWFTPTSVLSPEDRITIRSSRFSSNAADTYTGRIDVIGMIFEYNRSI